MIVIKLCGGLGNQMFQYAFGRSLALRRKEELFLDLSGYQKQATGDTLREFKLDQYRIQADICLEVRNARAVSLSWQLRQKIGLFLRGDYHMRFHQEYFSIKQDIYDGFFQSYKYFDSYENIIRDDFGLKTPLFGKPRELLDEIKSGSSVSIHVRRGDYVTNIKNYQGYGVCSVEYYQEAIKRIIDMDTNACFYVFSDDIEWVRENIKLPINARYVSELGFNEVIELYLMSFCKYNVIANSTFSWWAAWLNNNPNKMVFAPKKWANINNFSTEDLIPSDWIKI